MNQQFNQLCLEASTKCYVILSVVLQYWVLGRHFEAQDLSLNDVEMTLKRFMRHKSRQNFVQLNLRFCISRNRETDWSCLALSVDA